LVYGKSSGNIVGHFGIDPKAYYLHPHFMNYLRFEKHKNEILRTLLNQYFEQLQIIDSGIAGY